mgnify:CR=1 FL=1
MATDIYDIQQTLWAIADELRANSNLSSSEYSSPVLGLIFLKFADDRFDEARVELAGTGSDRRKIGPADYHAKQVLYLPPDAEFDALLENGPAHTGSAVGRKGRPCRFPEYFALHNPKTGSEIVIKDHDSGVVVTEPQFSLGTDHPFRNDPADAGGFQCHVPTRIGIGQAGTHSCKHDLLARFDVGGAAHNL